MKILSHRGYWKEASEKNLPVAFRRSFELGYGTETDVRDLDGKLVISHDMPSGDVLGAKDMLHMAGTRPLPLAINIKADGLAVPLAELFKGSQHEWFVFDMSIPDMRQHLNVGNPVYARMSEVEKYPAWPDEITGIWLDAFKEVWYDSELIQNLLRRGLKVCVVSPELHKRDHLPVWKILQELRNEPNLRLCTDIPEDATTYFGLN